MKVIRTYTGDLKQGDVYEGRADGNRIRVDNIYQRGTNKVWTVDLVYTHSHTKEGSLLPMTCFDFENMLKKGHFRKVN